MDSIRTIVLLPHGCRLLIQLCIFISTMDCSAYGINQTVLEKETVCLWNCTTAISAIVRLNKQNNSNVFNWIKEPEYKLIISDELYKGRIQFIPQSYAYSFCIKNVTIHDSGKYVLIQENPANMIKINIYVYSGPTNVNLNLTEKSVKVIKGSDLSINCSSDCYPNCNFMWKKTTVEKTCSTEVLSLTNMSKSAAGTYICHVCNTVNKSYCSKSAPLNIIVLYEPEIHLKHLNEHLVSEEGNSSVRLECGVDSNPPSNMSWTFNNQSVILKEYAKTSSTLRINESRCCDCGIYTCSANNGIGRPADAKYTLNVTSCTPKFDCSTEAYTVTKTTTIGSGVKFDVNVIANPAPIPKVLSPSRLNVTMHTITGSVCVYSVKVVIQNLHQEDIKEHVVYLDNGLGNATLVLNINLKSSNYHEYVIMVCVTTFLSAVIFFILMARQKIKLKNQLSAERNHNRSSLSAGDQSSRVEYRENVFYESSGRFTLEESDIRNFQAEGVPSNENDSLSRNNLSGQEKLPGIAITHPGIEENQEQSQNLNHVEADINSEVSRSSQFHGDDNETSYMQVNTMSNDGSLDPSSDIENIDGSHYSLNEKLSTTDDFCEDKRSMKPVPTTRLATKQKQTTELNYIEVEFTATESRPFQIHGLESKTNYVQVHILPKGKNNDDVNIEMSQTL